MFAEGFKLDECQLDTTLIIRVGDAHPDTDRGHRAADRLDRNARIRVSLNVVRPIRHMNWLVISAAARRRQSTRRRARCGSKATRPSCRSPIEDQRGGVAAEGPGVPENFSTCRPIRWRFEMNLSGDILPHARCAPGTTLSIRVLV